MPEQSLAGLQRALNTAQSPVFSSDFDASFRAQQRGRGSDAAEASTSRAGRNGTGPGGGWLRDMLNGAWGVGGWVGGGGGAQLQPSWLVMSSLQALLSHWQGVGVRLTDSHMSLQQW